MNTQRRRTGKVFAGVDVGNAKVSVVLATPVQGQLCILGQSAQSLPDTEQAKATMVEPQALRSAMAACLAEAAALANVDVPTDIYVSVPAASERSKVYKGTTRVARGTVSAEDVKQVLVNARRASRVPGRETLHVMPVDFQLDNSTLVRDPMNRAAHLLSARVQCVDGSVTRLQAVRQCARSLDLSVEGVAADVVAASAAVLCPDEKDHGVLLIDIGHAKTDIAVWIHGAMVHAAQIPFGGFHLAGDIGKILSVSRSEALRLKREYGCAWAESVNARETMMVASDRSRRHPRRVLATILEPRMREIMKRVREELDALGLSDSLTQAVVTGGSSMLDGTLLVVTDVLGIPARQGTPRRITGLVDGVRHPKYAAAVGVLLEAMDEQQSDSGASGLFLMERRTRWQQWRRSARELWDRFF
ncbi:MAG: cell division protein FtsA [Bradymonadia bacterium]|jgi:cell division protein FtsA